MNSNIECASIMDFIQRALDGKRCGFLIDIQTQCRSFDISDSGQVYQMLNSYIQRLLPMPSGPSWEEVPYDLVQPFLIRILTYDMAYSSRVMSDLMANECANKFLNIFEEDSRYFTNGTLHRNEEHAGWSPYTEHTFDTGVAAISRTRIGALWLMDED